VDSLFGSGGQDWFFARLSGGNKDKLVDRKSNELIENLI
jgi:hypothetical protein